jgi:hypothetical protein
LKFRWTEDWTEIDPKSDKNNLKDSGGWASFAVSNAAECSFIRVTQTTKSHDRYHQPTAFAFEVFETLLGATSPAASTTQVLTSDEYNDHVYYDD